METRPTFTFLSDPGHGWLLVPASELRPLGLSRKSFSPYSYRSKDAVFALEEDCDASVFIAAWKAKHGSDPTIVSETTNDDAACRSWPSV